MPVINLLPLISKFNLFICSLSMHLGPLNIFALSAGTTLTFVCRRCCWDSAEREGFASWFWCACLASSVGCFSSSSYSACGFLQHQGLPWQPAVLSDQQLHLLRQFCVECLQEDSFPQTPLFGAQRTHCQQAPKGRHPARLGGTTATSLPSVTYECPLL